MTDTVTNSLGAALKSASGTCPEVSDLLVAYLEELSVEYVFGVPGGAIEPLYNALARSARRGGPRPIVARHETGAAFMADGYARYTGKLGVCCSTTGPGATNLLTGVASAYENHIPMLIITAQTALSTFGTGAFQESSETGINTVGMFQYCTRYNTLVSHVDQFQRKLAAAILTAFQSPSGPTHLSIPLNIMRSPAAVRQPSFDLPALLRRPSLLDQDAVQQFCEELLSAKKVVFVLGDECTEAMGAIMQVTHRINAQFVTTPHGKGLVNAYHPLFRGVIGFAGHASARQALRDPEVDLIVATGTALGELESNSWDAETILNSRLIHVESTVENFTRSPMAHLHVRGRLLTIFEKVLEFLHSNDRHQTALYKISAEPTDTHERTDLNPQLKRHFQLDDEAEYYGDSAPIKPQWLMHMLARKFPPSTRFLADTGASFAWAIHYLHPFDRRIAERRLIDTRNTPPYPPGQRKSARRHPRSVTFRACLNFASMGWAIGSSLGVALAHPGYPVVCITGDGSWLMNGQEITVAVQEKLPIIFTILNDSALGMVKHGQRLTGAEQIGTGLPKSDFAACARAMGASGYNIDTPNDLLDLDVNALITGGGPTVLDVHIDPEEVPPIGLRAGTLRTNE